MTARWLIPTCLALAGCPTPTQPHADVGELVTRIEQLEADAAEREQAIEDLQVQLDEASLGVARVIVADTTIAVPADAPDVNAALRSLDDAVIASEAVVTIAIADGTYRYTESIEVRHRDGDRIHIIGNTGDPSAVTLEFPALENGILATTGNQLGYVDGLTLDGLDAPDSHGLEASVGGVVRAGPHLIVRGFQDGFRADKGGVLFVDGEAEPMPANACLPSSPHALSTDNARSGFLSVRGSVIFAPAAEAASNGTHGFTADRSSTLDVAFALAHDNTRNGFSAAGRSAILAEDSCAELNGWSGLSSVDQSHVRGTRAVAENNSLYGLVAESHGRIDAQGALEEYNGQVQPRTASPPGDVYVD